MIEQKLRGLPRSVTTQIMELPKQDELVMITNQLHQQVKQLLETNKIEVIDSIAATLTDLELLGRFSQISLNTLFTDIHSVKVTLNYNDVDRAAGNILNRWPSPNIYWWGLPAHLHPKNPKLDSKYKGYNLDPKNTYLSIRISQGAKLAQIQLTPVGVQENLK